VLCNHAIEWLSMAIANAISMPPLFKAPLISQALTVSLQLQKKKKKGLCNQRKASKKSSINGAARHKLARVSRKGAAAMAAMVVHG
jgi:hypothetical protein